MTLSARNHLKGTIEEIQLGDVLAHVTVRVGESVIESVITGGAPKRWRSSKAIPSRPW